MQASPARGAKRRAKALKPANPWLALPKLAALFEPSAPQNFFKGSKVPELEELALSETQLLDQTAALLMKPNVYADFSEQTWLISTRKLSEVVRDFLEWYPEKILFGTDLYPNTPEIDWEEIGYQTTQSGREALAIALTGMMQDGEITRAQALNLAHMVLHDNAAKLYGLH